MADKQPPDYKEYLRSARWRNISADMKKLSRMTCERCGRVRLPGELHVHHLTYDRLGRERRSDLQVVCFDTCHHVADAERVERVSARREHRRHENAVDTYLSKRYGDNYRSFEHPGMEEEAERWLARKRFEETGEDW